MENNKLFEKNNILNLGVVILALFIAFQLYRGINEQVNTLVQQKDDELKKNKAAEEITGLEKKLEGYKKILVKKSLFAVIETMSALAKESAVKVISIKPAEEETLGDYIKSSFSVAINAPDYHALGNFISRIESHRDIYLVDEVRISQTGTERAKAGSGQDLKINLKISSIAYL